MYQKIGLTVNRLACDLLPRKAGDRIPSISEYQQRFQVARGTVQNAINYLIENGAICLIRKGHLGTYIEQLDYRRLQECSFTRELLGTMPLPYSHCYQGLATALYKMLSDFSFNLVYARGAESRLRLVDSGVCQFTVCSRYAAQEAIENNWDVEIVADLGPGSYLSRHVLVLRDSLATGIGPGMRVAYDRASVDHRSITEMVTAGVPNVELVEMRAHKAVAAIRSGSIDASVWNLDEILESGYDGLNVVPVDRFADVSRFSSAVLVIRKGEDAVGQILRQSIDPNAVCRIQDGVRQGTIPADY